MAKRATTSEPDDEAPDIEKIGPPANIHQRMMKVMRSLEYLQKDGTVRTKSGGKMYTFVSHDKVTEAVRPLLLLEGILRTTNVVHVGDRTFIMEVHYINADNPAERLTYSMPLLANWSDILDMGKAISYTDKYLYLKPFLLFTGDDPEKDADEPPDQAPTQGFKDRKLPTGPSKTTVTTDKLRDECMAIFEREAGKVEHHEWMFKDESKQQRATSMARLFMACLYNRHINMPQSKEERDDLYAAVRKFSLLDWQKVKAAMEQNVEWQELLYLPAEGPLAKEASDAAA